MIGRKATAGVSGALNLLSRRYEDPSRLTQVLLRDGMSKNLTFTILQQPMSGSIENHQLGTPYRHISSFYAQFEMKLPAPDVVREREVEEFIFGIGSGPLSALGNGDGSNC